MAFLTFSQLVIPLPVKKEISNFIVTCLCNRFGTLIVDQVLLISDVNC